MNLPVEAKVEVGEKATEKLVDALVDAFSPATETLGLFGDAVRLARVDVAAKITKRAKEIADASGSVLKLPPLKFLVPFYERASIEEEVSESLMEMWSRLLASAASNYDHRYLTYISILAGMSPAQAKIINEIAHNYGGEVGRDSEPGEFKFEFAPTRIKDMIGQFSGLDIDNFIEVIEKKIFLPGICVVLLMVDSHKESKSISHKYDEDDVYNDDYLVEFDILESKGLLGYVDEDIDNNEVAVTITLYYMTELGEDFWRACCAQ